jgi:hypothetical protein
MPRKYRKGRAGDAALSAMRSIFPRNRSQNTEKRPRAPGLLDDQAWFARHPDRRYRARRCYRNECPGSPPGTFALIRQFEPGLRLRGFMCALPGTSTPELPADDERLLAALFNQLNGPSS